MKYYSYQIDYDPKNGSMGVVEVEKKMGKKALLKHLQDEGEVEEFAPRWFECNEITQEEYEDEMGIEHVITLEEIGKMPKKTPKQRQKKVEAYLEHLNQEYENNDDDPEDLNYLEGKRDGVSVALNELFGTGNGF